MAHTLYNTVYTYYSGAMYYVGMLKSNCVWKLVRAKGVRQSSSLVAFVKVCIANYYVIGHIVEVWNFEHTLFLLYTEN